MGIFVDADACPVKNIIVRIAKENSMNVTMVMDTAHEYSDGYSRVITVDKGRDSVDIFLINLVRENDIVVTQDYGVAAMALSKKALAINQYGTEFTNSNIDAYLDIRHKGQKHRSSGGKVSGPRKRKNEDDINFEKQFLKVIEVAESYNIKK